MPLFAYKVRDVDGRLQEGRTEALSAEALAGQFQAGQAIPIQIVEIAESRSRGKSQPLFRQRKPRVRLDDLILFCRQMYTLSNAGVPLTRALRGLIETSRNPTLGEALGQVVEDLESGQDFSGALSRHAGIFPPLLCRLVQVGEHTGKLDDVFLQLSVYFEREKETINRVKQALRYPIFVLTAILFAVFFLSLFVIPTFGKIFAKAGAELPLATRIILGLSRFMQDYWIFLIAAACLVAFAISRALKTERGRYLWDRCKLRLPLTGHIALLSTLVRFSRAFSMSYSAGVPLSQALGFTARAVDNLFVGEKIESIRNSIERGDTLTRSANQAGIFTPLVLQMLAVGEETGSIDSVLDDIASFYEREVDYDLKSLSAAIEPIMIIIIGGMVLVLALGVFLPMWNLYAVIK